jgi:hypothetical protein
MGALAGSHPHRDRHGRLPPRATRSFAPRSQALRTRTDALVRCFRLSPLPQLLTVEVGVGRLGGEGGGMREREGGGGGERGRERAPRRPH